MIASHASRDHVIFTVFATKQLLKSSNTCRIHSIISLCKVLKLLIFLINSPNILLRDLIILSRLRTRNQQMPKPKPTGPARHQNGSTYPARGPNRAPSAFQGGSYE